MPLEKGDNPQAIAHNVRLEEQHGHPAKQAVAIALHTAKDEATFYPVGPTIAEQNAYNREMYDPVPVEDHIVELSNGDYRLESKETHRNLGTYPTKAGAEKRERAVEYFKHGGA